MTLEERIKKLENELAVLKHEGKKGNVWKQVKEEFQKDFNSFSWVDEWSFTDKNGNVNNCSWDMEETQNVSSAIGTIVRITLKKKRLDRLEESDREVTTSIVKDILEIMKRERR